MNEYGVDIEGELDAVDIEKIIPHRYPFLLVDKVESIDFKENKIIGRKCVSMNEGFFQGHFPSNPIMPGVLILESMAQTAGILLQLTTDPSKTGYLLNVTDAKFRHPVRPGDVLNLFADAQRMSSRAGKFNCKAKVGDAVVAEAVISLAIVDKPKI